MSSPVALVFAAGTGSRLRPLTDTLPKCLVPVAGRPLLEYWLTALADAGVGDLTINTHHLREQMHRYLLQVHRRGAQRVTEAFEPQLLGSAGTVTAHRALADRAEDLLLVYADNYSSVDLAGLLAYHRTHDSPVTMLLFRTTRPRDCGIAQLDEAGRIVAFEEKPADPPGNLANAGVYVVRAEAFREMADLGATDLARDVLPRFVGRMRGWVHEGCHLDVGTPDGYARALAAAGAVNAARGMSEDGRRPAVFLACDGVLIERERAGPEPGAVRLVPGADRGVVAMRRAGYACIVAGSREAMDRSPADRQPVIDRFAARGAIFDAVYGRVSIPAGPWPCPGTVERAVDELRLDAARSWIVTADSRGTLRCGPAADQVDCGQTTGQVPPGWLTMPDLRAVADVLCGADRLPVAAGTR